MTKYRHTLALYVSIHKDKDHGMTYYRLYSILDSPILTAISDNLIDVE